jgi:hypothetical protein
MRWFAHIAVGLDDAVLHYASGPCARWDGTPSSGARGDRQECCVHNRPVTERLVRPATRPRSRRRSGSTNAMWKRRPPVNAASSTPGQCAPSRDSTRVRPETYTDRHTGHQCPCSSGGTRERRPASVGRRRRHRNRRVVQARAAISGCPPLKVAREQSGCSHRKRRLRQIRYVVDRSSRGGGLEANGTRRERKVARRLSAPYVVR